MFIASIIASAVNPSSVSAFDQTFYSYNDILFYNKDACSPSSKAKADEGSEDASGNKTATTASFSKSDALEKIYKQLLSYKFNRGQIAAIMGNFYGETTTFDSSIEEPNGMGYGLAQWSGGRRTALEAYAKTKGVAVSDASLQIEFLNKEYNDTFKATLDDTAFAKGTDIEASTQAWMQVFENPYIDPDSNDPANINTKRIPGALKIDELYGSLAGGSINNLKGCANNGVVAGSIVKTSINLALTTPITEAESNAGTKVNKADARDTYQVAKEKYNPANGSSGVPSWSDCGGFVATVMRGSGVDKEFPAVNVSAQIAYVQNNPSKYAVFDDIRSVSDLEPGDILYVDNDQYAHTVIFTGDTKYPSVDASLDQRVPGVRPTEAGAKWMLNQTGTIVVRVLK